MRRVLFGAFVILLVAVCSLVPGGAPPTPAIPPVTQAPPPLEGPVVEQPQLTTFHMLTERDGWGGTESALLRTDDGGDTWHDVTPEGSDFPGYGLANSALDAGRAAIVIPDETDPLDEGTLYVTQDGGRSWESNPVPFGVGQVHFFDDLQNGWAMASLGVGAGSNAIAIYQTTDGGATWERRFTNLPTDPDASDDIPMGGLKGVFLPLDMQRAWVGGVVYSDRTSYLFRTDDGGRTWRQVELEAPNDEQAQWSVESIQFVSDQTGFLTMQVTAQNFWRAVYVTRDRGDTWELTPTLIPNGRAADFVSETEGFVFDGEQFHFTQDAGGTWRVVEPDVVFSESFMSMDFVDTDTGWVTASDPTTFSVHVYKTTDGGRTWTPQ